MKPCPDCAEDVKADARVCRYCRHEFAPPPSRPKVEAVPVPSNTHVGQLRQIKWILVIAAIVVVAAFATQSINANHKRADHDIHCINYPYASDCS